MARIRNSGRPSKADWLVSMRSGRGGGPALRNVGRAVVRWRAHGSRGASREQRHVGRPERGRRTHVRVQEQALASHAY